MVPAAPFACAIASVRRTGSSEIAEPRSGSSRGRRAIGYRTLPPRGVPHPRALRRKHMPAAVSAKSLRVSGETYPVGTLFLRREGAPSDFDAAVADLARSTGTDFDGVESAWTEEGIALGSQSFVPWKPVRIGLLAGPGMDRSSAGWALDAFTRVFRYPVSVLDVDAFDDADLSRYDVLVFPDGSARVIAALGKRNAEALRAWTRAGGVIVAIGAGAALLREKDVGLAGAE